jgi:hypothetical protein
MVSKSECWFNIIGGFLLIGLCYVMIYLSPNFEQLKIIIPLLSAFSGYWIYKNKKQISGEGK